MDLDKWFGVPHPETLAVPKVTPTATILAEEVLRKALEARGGSQAALSIRSFHAKGMYDADCGWLATSPVEIFATRSNKWRFVIDQKSPMGLKLDGYGSGFDGLNSWETQDGAVTRLKGKRLEQNRDDAEFFACYDDPQNYQSVESLGETTFEGRKCYALKLVTKSGRQKTHYYDAANFLLSGTMETVEIGGAPTLLKKSFADYREFGGFKFPMRQCSQTQFSKEVMQYGSIEVNRVEDLALKMPVQPHTVPRR
ncbi:MAG: hypothetical protein JWQ71_4420 [Pedosphaera sp.]|nr:hypothetical protein [Pedosphaera sp.]